MNDTDRRTGMALIAAVCGLLALVLVSAASGAAGSNFMDGPGMECALHRPSGWDESTTIEADFHWFPPGTDCTYRNASGETREWRTSRPRALAFAGAAAAVALAGVVALRERRRR